MLGCVQKKKGHGGRHYANERSQEARQEEIYLREHGYLGPAEPCDAFGILDAVVGAFAGRLILAPFPPNRRPMTAQDGLHM